MSDFVHRLFLVFGIILMITGLTLLPGEPTDALSLMIGGYALLMVILPRFVSGPVRPAEPVYRVKGRRRAPA